MEYLGDIRFEQEQFTEFNINFTDKPEEKITINLIWIIEINKYLMMNSLQDKHLIFLC